MGCTALPAAREDCQPRYVGQAAGASSQPGAGSRVPLGVLGGSLVTVSGREGSTGKTGLSTLYLKQHFWLKSSTC